MNSTVNNCMWLGISSKGLSDAFSLASPVVAFFTAGVALLLVPLSSAHAVILYGAPGTAGLIVTLLPLPAFTYSIIGTPKRITSYPVIIRVVSASFLCTWNSTLVLDGMTAVSSGTLTVTEGWTVHLYVYILQCIHAHRCKLCTCTQYNSQCAEFSIVFVTWISYICKHASVVNEV